ncbi:MAG: IS3 family transposase [Chloroflexi bacterium]|nr:IS3 family transposase [Chloroflexota bacterium]
MPNTHRPYAPEFRQQMVELVRSGRTPEELALEYEPSAGAIRNWVVQQERDAGRRDDGLSSDERQELRRLRRENKQLRMERDILKKAGGLVRTGERLDPGAGFEFVKANQASWPVRTICRVLGLSASGYYAWVGREPSARARRDGQLVERITTIWRANRKVYGRPRIHAELQAEGERVGQKRIARLMKQAGIEGASRRRSAKTTTRGEASRPAPDLVDRDFSATGADQLWVGDITYVPTWAGFLYLAVVLDAWSRRVVGWSMAGHLRTELVLEALEMAIWQRRPEQVIHHSDQGSQYTSIAFGARCKEAGVRPSMGSVGDAYDNALCESFFATLECELLDQRRFRSRGEARLAVFEFIEGFYNRRRRHSALGYQSPVAFEAARAAGAAA